MLAAALLAAVAAASPWGNWAPLDDHDLQASPRPCAANLDEALKAGSQEVLKTPSGAAWVRTMYADGVWLEELSVCTTSSQSSPSPGSRIQKIFRGRPLPAAHESIQSKPKPWGQWVFEGVHEADCKQAQDAFRQKGGRVRALTYRDAPVPVFVVEMDLPALPEAAAAQGEVINICALLPGTVLTFVRADPDPLPAQMAAPAPAPDSARKAPPMVEEEETH